MINPIFSAASTLIRRNIPASSSIESANASGSTAL